MTEDQLLTEEIAKIRTYAGICGVLFIIAGLLLEACGFAGYILHDVTFEYPLYTLGFAIAGFGVGSWTLFTGICYLNVSFKGIGNANHLHLRMTAFMVRWSIFALVVHGGAILILAYAFHKTRTDADTDTRLLILAQTSIAGCAVLMAFTIIANIHLFGHIETLGIRILLPTKKELLSVYISHGCLLLLLSVHQVTWTLVALIVPAFDTTNHIARVLAFCLGGFLGSIVALLTAAMCFRIIAVTKSVNEHKRVMTTSLMHVHRFWGRILLPSHIVGAILHVGSLTILGEDTTNWWPASTPVYVVFGHVFSMFGNLLTGYLILAVTFYEQYMVELGLKTSIAPVNSTNGSGGAITAPKTRTKPAPKPTPTKTRPYQPIIGHMGVP